MQLAVALRGEDPTQDPTAILSVKQYKLKSGTLVWASYNCPPCDTAIRTAQYRLNWFAGLVGKAAIAVDGLVGSGTVNFGKAVASYALAKGVLVQGGLLQAYVTSAQIFAQHAHVVADMLLQIASAVGIDTSRLHNVPAPAPTPSAPPPTRPGQLPIPMPSPSLPPDAILVTSVFQKISVGYWVAGGIVLLGLGVATYLVWKPPAHHQPGM